MKNYRVHFTGYYGYDVSVEAENREQALELAEMQFDKVSPEEYHFEAMPEDIIENEEQQK